MKRILVRKMGQRMWVSNPERIAFWEAVASRSGSHVVVLKRVE